MLLLKSPEEWPKYLLFGFALYIVDSYIKHRSRLLSCIDFVERFYFCFFQMSAPALEGMCVI